MTIANQTNRTSAVGNAAIGQEVPFPFPIKFTSDLLVKKRVTATGVEVILDETTNYTVVINDDIGGTLTTVTAIELTEQIHIIRNTPKTQTLDLEQGGSFNAENIEDALDKNTKLAIENKDAIGKAITFPATDAAALTTELPSSIDGASKVVARDSSGNITMIDAVPEGSVAFSTFGTNMAEAANALAGKVVINLDHVIDVRDYGTVGDGSTDDTAAIQAAFDAAPYKTVFFPSGIYKITSTIDVGVSTSVIGVGFNSRILAVACDAFEIPHSGSLGGTEWSKIQIYGDSSSASYKAIKALGNIDSAFAAGITFRKLYINKIGTGFFLRGLSFSRIADCTFNDVWNGIHIEGQCLRLQIVGNDILRDAFLTGVVTGGAGNATGIIIDDASDYNPGGVTTKFPESIMISHNSISQFEVAVNHITGLYVTIFSNDFDRQTINGITFGSKSGTLAIKNNWINVTGAAAMYGIQGTAYIGGVDHDLVALIEHNRITATSSPHADSAGIRIGTNQNNVITQYNDILGFQLYDIYYVANKGGIVKQNRCASTDPVTYSIFMSVASGPHWVSENNCTKAVYNAISSVPKIVCNENQVVCNENQVVMN